MCSTRTSLMSVHQQAVGLNSEHICDVLPKLGLSPEALMSMSLEAVAAEQDGPFAPLQSLHRKPPGWGCAKNQNGIWLQADTNSRPILAWNSSALLAKSIGNYEL